MPTNRKGSNSSHTIGYRISASTATGQHSTKRKHQSRKATMGATPPEYDTHAERKSSVVESGGLNLHHREHRGTQRKERRGKRWLVDQFNCPLRKKSSVFLCVSSVPSVVKI